MDLMKAQLLVEHGKNAYRYNDIKIPEIKEDHVLVQVLNCSINNTDIWTRDGLYSNDNSGSGWQPLDFPIIQGADIVGKVVKIYSNDDIQLLEQNVIVYPVVNNRDTNDSIKEITECQYMGSEINGGYAEYCLVKRHNVFVIPETCLLTDAQWSCIPTAYMTAYYMIKRADIDDIDTCLVSGASGGVGLALIHLLNIWNIKTIAICAEEKEHLVQLEGAWKTVSRTEDGVDKELEEIKNDIMCANNYKPYDIVFDVVAGNWLNTFIDVLKVGGKYVCSGAIGGRNVEIFWPKFYLKHIDLLGSMLCPREEFLELLDLVFKNYVFPKVHKVFYLNDLEKAHQLFESKKFIGKIVLNCLC